MCNITAAHLEPLFAIVAPLKGRPRAKSKAQFKYADERGDIAWYRLTDVVRASICQETIQGMYECLRAIVQDPELNVIEYNDRYLTPRTGGYETCNWRSATAAMCASCKSLGGCLA